MAKLTRPDGEPVWVNAAAAISVRTPLPGEYAPTVKTVIKLGRSQQGVRETVAMVKRTLRERSRFALIMLDVDWFKPFNDRYGHPAGDACLKRVAQAIEETFKASPDESDQA